MKVGLFFGSFNPIHMGHLIIANSICETSNLDEVCFVVSPQNPFKEKKGLAPANLRMQWVDKAVEDNPRLKASGIELDLPIPSYTHQTLEFLQSDANDYHLIMGSDTFLSLPKWKNASDFIYDYPIEIYNRPGASIKNLDTFPKATLHKLPLLELSASYIREQCSQGSSISYLVQENIEEAVIAYYSKN